MAKFTIKTLIILFLAISCKNNDNHKIKISKEVSSFNIKDSIEEQINPKTLYGKTFYKVTKTDSIDILFYPCDANINTIKVYKDSIYEDFGQEDYTMKIDKKELDKNKIIVFGLKKQLTPEKKYEFSLIDNNKGYWKINNKIFIDSLYIEKILIIKQPCTDCWSKEECDEMERQEKLKEK